MPRFYFRALPDGALPVYEAPYAYVGPPDLQGIADVSDKFVSDGKKYWVVHQSLDIHQFGDKAMYTGPAKAIVTEHGFDASSPVGFHKWFRHRVAAVSAGGLFILTYRCLGYSEHAKMWSLAGLVFLPDPVPEKHERWHYEGSSKHAATLAWMAVHGLGSQWCNRRKFLYHTDYNVLRRKLRSLMCASRSGARNHATPSS